MFRQQGVKVAAGVFLASLSVMLLRFLVPRPVGMADNGDGWRLLCQLGAGNRATFQQYVQFGYPPGAPCTSQYVSSQMWLDRPVQWLGRALGADSVLNLYLLAAVCIFLAAFGIAMIVVALKLSRGWQIATTVLLLLVVADSAFFGYFVAPLSEGVVFLGVLLLVAGLFVMQQDNRWRYLGTAVTVVGALFAINAKVQTLAFLPALVLAVLVMRRRWVLKILVIVLVSAGTYFTQTSGGSAAGDEYREINMYHAIFGSILDGKHDTKGDLRDLGLPESFEKYVGQGWWAPNPAHADPLYPQYRHLISRRNVVKFYLEHPIRTLQILQVAAQDQLTARPAHMGSFEADSGQPPFAKEYRVPVLSGITALVAPLGLFFLVPLWSFILWAGLRVWWRRRAFSVVILVLLEFALSQFLLAALAEGTAQVESVKHQVGSLFCVLLAGVFAVVSLSGNAPPVFRKLFKGRGSRGDDVERVPEVAEPAQEEVRQ